MIGEYDPQRYQNKVPQPDAMYAQAQGVVFGCAGQQHAAEKPPSVAEELRSRYTDICSRADTLNWLVRALEANPPAKHIEQNLRNLFNFV